MSHYNEDYSLFFYSHPEVPALAPLLGISKSLEQDNDYAYLKYLYPQIVTPINEFIEEECDQLEYDGSPMFDQYPDRTRLHLHAMNVYRKCHTKDPERFPDDNPILKDLVEILLDHEFLYRRNRYRNRKRLYL